MENELQKFDIKKAVEDYSEKKGYTEGVRYYHKIIRANRAVRNSDFYPIVQEFDAALKDFINEDSSTALVDMNNIFMKYYSKDGELPDLFVSEGLEIAFNNISEYLMHLSKLLRLDYYA